MNNNKIDLSNFDFSQFQKEAIDKLKSGQDLTGKDGILTPLFKGFLRISQKLSPWRHLFKKKPN
jgi:hypothetical protein